MGAAPSEGSVAIGMQPRVVIGLSQRKLEGHLASLSGRRSAALALNASDWSEAWDQGLRPLDGPLVELCQKLGLSRGTSVWLAFQSRTGAVEIVPTPARTPAAGAVAAKLRVLDDLGSDAASSALACQPLPAGPRDSGLSMIVGWETETSGELMRQWLRRAGLGLMGLVPAMAVTAHDAAGAVRRDADPRTLWLHIDELGSVLSAAGPTGFLFLRPSALGYGLLVDVVRRALADAALPPEGAGAALLAHGVPATAETGYTALGLADRDVLAGMQPLIQRLHVEIKQTLRFSTAASGQSFNALHVTGPGAAVPGLADALARGLEVDVRADANPGEATPAARLARGKTPSLVLVPRSELRRRAVARWRRTLTLSSIGAALALGAQGALLYEARAELHARDATLDAELEAAQAQRDALVDAAALADRLRQATHVTAGVVGRRPDWAAALALVAERAGPGVRLTQVVASKVGGVPWLRITGFAPAATDTAAGARTPLSELMASLDSSPLVGMVALRAQRATVVDSVPGDSFEIAIELVATPSMPAALLTDPLDGPPTPALAGAATDATTNPPHTPAPQSPAPDAVAAVPEAP